MIQITATIVTKKPARIIEAFFMGYHPNNVLDVSGNEVKLSIFYKNVKDTNSLLCGIADSDGEVKEFHSKAIDDKGSADEKKKPSKPGKQRRVRKAKRDVVPESVPTEAESKPEKAPVKAKKKVKTAKANEPKTPRKRRTVKKAGDAKPAESADEVQLTTDLEMKPAGEVEVAEEPEQPVEAEEVQKAEAAELTESDEKQKPANDVKVLDNNALRLTFSLGVPEGDTLDLRNLIEEEKSFKKIVYIVGKKLNGVTPELFQDIVSTFINNPFDNCSKIMDKVNMKRGARIVLGKSCTNVFGLKLTDVLSQLYYRFDNKLEDVIKAEGLPMVFERERICRFVRQQILKANIVEAEMDVELRAELAEFTMKKRMKVVEFLKRVQDAVL